MRKKPTPANENSPGPGASLQTFMDLGWDPRGFLERLDTIYEIIDRRTHQRQKFGPLIRANKIQLGFLKMIMRMVLRGGAIRLIVLKSRKHGFSTLVMCLIYDLATHIPNFRGGVLSADADATRVLRDMLDRFYMWTPPLMRPELAKNNTRELRFGKLHVADINAGEIGLESQIQCRTARGKNPLTGDDIRGVLLSEFGKYNYDRMQQTNLMTSVMNSIPPSGASIVVAESTAQGTDNMFHDTWQIAEENAKNGREPLPGEWAPYFAPAHADPMNVREVEPGYDWADWPPEDILFETALVNECNVSPQFLRWRRNKIREIGFDYRKNAEDFPCRPVDAFMATMMSFIPPSMLDTAQKYVQKPAGTFSGRLEAHDAPFGADAVVGW